MRNIPTRQQRMLRHMRTTINLPEGLGEEAKRQAAESGRTFTSLVVEGIHLVLHKNAGSDAAPELPRHGGHGGRLLVSLTDKAAVMEGGAPLSAVRSRAEAGEPVESISADYATPAEDIREALSAIWPTKAAA